MQKVWRLGYHEFGFYLPQAVPSDIRAFLEADENVERPGAELVVSGRGPWVDELTCEEVRVSSAQFDTDAVFVNAGHGALNIAVAAMQADRGQRIQRHPDRWAPLANNLSQMNRQGFDMCVQHFKNYDGKKTSPYLRKFGSLRPLCKFPGLLPITGLLITQSLRPSPLTK